MIFYKGCFYFVSNSFYTLPSADGYNLAKSSYLASISDDNHSSYASKTKVEKWAYLIIKLHSLLIANDIPDTLTLETILAHFNKFKATRKLKSLLNESDTSTLTIEECIRYFEDFVFLFATQDQQYKLSPFARKKCLQSVLDAIGACETGSNVDLYAVLQEFKRDSNWIGSELSKARTEELRAIEQKYSQDNNSHNVHVFNSLMTLADKAQLGIDCSLIKTDKYSSMVYETHLKNFFTQHYPSMFRTYEHQSVKRLSLYLLIIMQTNLVLSSELWNDEQANVLCSDDQRTALIQLLNGHFQGANVNGFYKMDVETEEALIINQLPVLQSQSQCAKMFEDLIIQKLIVDGFYLPITVLDHPHAQEQTKFHADISTHDLLALRSDLQQGITDKLALKTYQHLILTYPQLILDYIRQDLRRIFSIPSFLSKHVVITDGFIKIIDNQMMVAMKADSQAFASLEDILKEWMGDNHSYLKYLSPEVLNELSLEPNSAMAVERLSEANHDLKERITTLNSSVSFLDLNPRNEQDRDKTAAQQVNKIKCLMTCLWLSTTPSISARDFLREVRNISPLFLQSIIHYRKAQKMSPLPFCGHSKVEDHLSQFGQNVENDLWFNDMLSVRLKAYENMIEYPDAHSIDTYLSKNDQWFMAFVPYHHDRNNLRHELYSAFKSLAWYLFSLSLDLGTVFLLITYYHIALSLMISTVTLYFSTILTWEVLMLLFIPNQILKGLITIMLLLTTIVWAFPTILYAATGIVVLVLSLSVISGLYMVFSSLFSLLTAVYEWIRNALTPTQKNTWEDQCDLIIQRLTLMDEDGAKQKALLLTSLLEKMKTETNAAEHLKTVYTIQHEGTDISCSFQSVAAQRRLSEDTFNMDASSSLCCGFFKPKTSSEQLLDAIIPSVHESSVF